MKQQRTFKDGEFAAQWLSQVSSAFEIKKAKIIRFTAKAQKYVREHFKWRVEVEFE